MSQSSQPKPKPKSNKKRGRPKGKKGSSKPAQPLPVINTSDCSTIAASLSVQTVANLKRLAKNCEISGYSKLKKAKLVKWLTTYYLARQIATVKNAKKRGSPEF